MMQLNTAKHNKCSLPAFTLIELLIVMVVIVILVGITIPISKYATYRARLASQKIYIEKIKSALEDYRAAYGEYPITLATNDAGQVLNYDDVLRHYPANYLTKCYYTTNSPFTNINLTASNIEILQTDQATYLVDYSLTYPLMLKQRLEGTQPFMDDFKELTVTYLVYNPVEIKDVDVFDSITRRKKKGGGINTIIKQYILGKPINRYKAIDPLTRMQWKYTSDGITYNLTNHTAAEGF
jgi:prepilin-type N-terminal cleavage/methylation domain-containing protein